MNSSNGLFLESLFIFMGVAMIILDNNAMIPAIMCFLVAGLIDLTWEWE